MSVRFATTADKASMLKITEKTWDWGDYIPSVIDGWLKQENGRMFVGYVERELVAFVHLSFERGALGWMEGMRVKESYRGIGIATELSKSVVEYASAIGLKRLRMAISESNVPSLRHAIKAGFREKCSFKRLLVAASLSEECVVDAIPTPEQILKSLSYQFYRGLIFKDFRWLDLDEELIDDYVALGRIMSIAGTIFIHTSDYVDRDKSRVAEVGYFQPSSRTRIECLQTVFARKLYDWFRIIVPSDMSFDAGGKMKEEGEPYLIFEMLL